MAEISRQVPPMFGGQTMMSVGRPVMHPMSVVQPMHSMYGMPVGENSNSCYGVLQQV
ncbi:hypothetical protein A2U01_0080699, partial [Trifolium medium]|nr:hypothetical protein [Trifolium medium]